MLTVGFEPTISAGLRPRGYWDRHQLLKRKKSKFLCASEVGSKPAKRAWWQLQPEEFDLPGAIDYVNRCLSLLADPNPLSTSLFALQQDSWIKRRQTLEQMYSISVSSDTLNTSLALWDLKFSWEWTRRTRLSWVRSNVLCCNIIRTSRGPKPTTHNRNAVILIYQNIWHHVREDSNSQWFLTLIYCRQKCVVTAVQPPWHYNILTSTLKHTKQLDHCISQRQLRRHVSTFLLGRPSKFVHIKTFKVAWLWLYYRRNLSPYVFSHTVGILFFLRCRHPRCAVKQGVYCIRHNYMFRPLMLDTFRLYMDLSSSYTTDTTYVGCFFRCGEGVIIQWIPF